jgi:Protein of unknown function (DUF2800)
MTDHARLSASAAHRWIKCPGSLALIESLPEHLRNKSSKYADEGSAAHSLASLSLGNDISTQLVRRNCITNEHSAAWTDAMATDVQPYIDLVRDMSDGHTLLVEQRVDYSKAIGVPDSFGTADAIIVTADGKELIICDLKFGRGVEVSAEENEQLMLYALGAIETFDMVIDVSQLERIRLVISQPRLNAVSEWDCTVERLEEFRILATRHGGMAIENADNRRIANILLYPSESACRFCPAASICPALAKNVEQTLENEFTALDHPKHVLIPTPDDAATLSLKMKAIPMIESWCTAVRAAVEARLFAGEVVDDFKLVQGKKGNRKWSSEDEAIAMLKSFRLKMEDMYDMTVISPTKAEKLFTESPTRWKRLQALVTRVEGKASVALMDDKRPALDVSNNDFQPLTNKE